MSTAQPVQQTAANPAFIALIIVGVLLMVGGIIFTWASGNAATNQASIDDFSTALGMTAGPEAAQYQLQVIIGLLMTAVGAVSFIGALVVAAIRP